MRPIVTQPGRIYGIQPWYDSRRISPSYSVFIRGQSIGGTRCSNPFVVYVESNRMSQSKKTVIDILRESRDFVSGEVISARLGISRNAVHKHVNSLRKRGYTIVGVSRRGYKLEDEPRPVLHGAHHRSHSGQHLRPLVPLLRRDRVHQR